LTIKACYDRQLPEVVKRLTAYQLPEPIHLRVVSPQISDFDLDRKSFSERLLMLRFYKNAAISVLVDRKWVSDFVSKNGEKPDIIVQLEEADINVMTVRNLHAKIALLKTGRTKALLVGSSNYTKTAMYISHEVGIYMLNDDSGTFEELDYYVTKLFKSAQPIVE
jgi:phosphatidylserine/phosphatidylglycerophosphate/cardiolipin synthase-like enzyme